MLHALCLIFLMAGFGRNCQASEATYGGSSKEEGLDYSQFYDAGPEGVPAGQEDHVEYTQNVIVTNDASESEEQIKAKSGYHDKSDERNDYDDDHNHNDDDDDDDEDNYGRKKKVKKVYVPVFVPEKEKKKMKILNVEKGHYIQGGTQLYGKFKTLKQCMKACAITPTCFSADYNPWLHKCYTHTNLTACDSQRSHSQFVHFSKVPCRVIEAPAGSVTLGVSVANGIEQKGIDSLQKCIKNCVTAGAGIQPYVTGNTSAALLAAFGSQACFAIDYDFATHKCFSFGSNIIALADNNNTNLHFLYEHCPANLPASAPPTLPTSLNARANPTVVHITFCPSPARV